HKDEGHVENRYRIRYRETVVAERRHQDERGLVSQGDQCQPQEHKSAPHGSPRLVDSVLCREHGRLLAHRQHVLPPPYRVDPMIRAVAAYEPMCEIIDVSGQSEVIKDVSIDPRRAVASLAVRRIRIHALPEQRIFTARYPGRIGLRVAGRIVVRAHGGPLIEREVRDEHTQPRRSDKNRYRRARAATSSGPTGRADWLRYDILAADWSLVDEIVVQLDVKIPVAVFVRIKRDA